MRTKSSNTSACGACANCEQPFGKSCKAGSNILPSFCHFIGLLQLALEHSQAEAVPSDLVAQVGHVRLSSHLEQVRIADHFRVPAAFGYVDARSRVVPQP